LRSRLFHHMTNVPLCVCCIPHVPPGDLARHTSATLGTKVSDEGVDTLGLNTAAVKHQKARTQSYCSKECEFTRETMRATPQFAYATKRAEQRRAEQRRKMKFAMRCAACGQLFLPKRSAMTCSNTCKQLRYRQLTVPAVDDADGGGAGGSVERGIEFHRRNVPFGESELNLRHDASPAGKTPPQAQARLRPHSLSRPLGSLYHLEDNWVRWKGSADRSRRLDDRRRSLGAPSCRGRTLAHAIGASLSRRRRRRR
jgi:ribosomal protein L32